MYGRWLDNYHNCNRLVPSLLTNSSGGLNSCLEKYYPKGFTPVWATDNMSLATKFAVVHNNCYADLGDGTQHSDCPLPCLTTTFLSSFLSIESQNSKTSSIEITLKDTVTVFDTDFVQISFVEFLSSFGGSVGLWLGVGVLQTLKISFEFFRSLTA